MSFSTKSPAFTSISEKQRSRILAAIPYDHIYLKMREGSGTTLNDSGNLAASNPGTSAITGGSLTVAGTTTNIWSDPNTGLDVTANDNYAGVNRDTDLALCQFFELTNFTGYLLISTFVDLEGTRPTGGGDYLWGVGGSGGGKYGAFACRYASNGYTYSYAYGTNNGGAYISAQIVSGRVDGGTPGKKHIVQVIDMTNGWSQMKHCLIVDGVLGEDGWALIDSGVIAQGPPTPIMFAVGGTAASQSPTTTINSSLNNSGIKHMKDFFAVKLNGADFTQSSIEAMCSEWSNYPSEFPFGLIV